MRFVWGVVPENDFQVGVRGGEKWLGKLEEGGVVAGDGSAVQDGPSGAGILIERTRDFPDSLLKGGLGMEEGKLLFSQTFLVEINFKSGEDEVSAVASADAALGIGGMTKGIEPDGGDGLVGKGGLQGVSEFGGVAAGSEEGAVGMGLDDQSGIAGFGRGEGEGRPGFGMRCFALLLFPVRLPGKELGGEFGEFLIVLGDFGVELGEGFLLFERGRSEDGFGLRITAASVDGGLVEKIE